MNKDFFIKQLEGIIADFNIVKSKAQFDDLSGNTSIEEITAVLTKSKAAIARIVGTESEYYKDTLATLSRTNINDGNKLRHVIGTIEALKSDLENDYLKTFSEIIQSEVFSDYLEMAEHLLNEGYKDPAAVLCGSTLEVNLRELCAYYNLDTNLVNSKGKIIPKKADLMNADLSKAGAYSLAYQKQIVAWLDIRNAAAHGNYSDYSNEEVSLMIQGIRHFLLSAK